ncbi:MAG: hypothetical protein EVJ46_05145 [Candidatus Acididesulfobacter guangdongensis]|uniref:Alginate export domain-containing protein n=1 Tax=Acididesulfobacter guangdongensis TaxID=2597225 RepID=A0A519BGN3_ACIG2|nr:MAG: hypothetical protein EVJ46_05145 [Candidatus Acididesulfobacter guangdongensis]
MRSKSILSAAFIVALAGFLAVTMMATPSFAASQANKAGVSFSLNGQYLAIGEWAQNQAQAFVANQSPNKNTYEAFLQRLRLNSTVSYDKLAHGMPLAMLAVQMDLTNSYNGITDGYGTNGYYMLGGTPAPTGFNNDFNTFGLRQAYIRLITPVGAIMFGRMPVKFGLGVAVNTNADGLGDFIPLGNIGIFAGTLFGSEVSAYDTTACTSTTPAGPFPSTDCSISGTTEGYYPPATEGYTHIQMGTIPTIEVMTMKPVDHASYSAWLTEAHLNQFEAGLTSANTAYTGGTTTSFTTASSIGSIQPTANITFGGVSVKYSNAGTKFGLEADYFRGRIIDSNQSIHDGFNYLPVQPNGQNQYDGINSYDLYLTGSTMLHTATPMSVGLKFGVGAPIASGDYNFTYYSTVQNTKTLFGDVIGSSWQPIQFTAPGQNYIYGGLAGESVGPNLADKYVIMVDAREYLPSSNTLKESLIHAAWLHDTINGQQEFGGSDIGTEFDLNFTHHFTKTLAFQAWGSYVWTGAGVESVNSSGTFAGAETKDITALGSDISWNF